MCVFVSLICWFISVLGSRSNSQTSRSYTYNLESIKATRVNTGKVRHEFTVSIRLSLSAVFVASRPPRPFRDVSAVASASRRPEAFSARPESLWCIHKSLNYAQCLSAEPP